MTTEWIEHHGKGYPDLPMDTLVQVRFRKGPDSSPDNTVLYWSVNWQHEQDDHACEDDIVAYRVVTP